VILSFVPVEIVNCCMPQGGTPAAAAVVREVGNYDHHHVALKQLEEQRAANGVSQILFNISSYCFVNITKQSTAVK